MPLTYVFYSILSTGIVHLEAQHITITSPNGGEKWEASSTQIIKWESNGIKEVKIEYSLDGGLSWGIVVQSTDASSGEFSWITADAQTPYVLIKISNASNSFIYDISDEEFSIVINKDKLINKADSIGVTIKIMPLGDSITWGTNPDDPNSPGYRRTLDSLLRAAGYNFDFVGSLKGGLPDDFVRDNEGHGGWDAYHPTLPNRSLLDSLNKFLTNNPPDIILLHIGTNDLWGDNASTLAGDVKKLLDTIFTFNPDIKVVIAKITDRADTEIRHNRTMAFNNTELPNMINSLPAAQQEKIILVNMYDSLGVYWNNFTNPNFTYGTDNLHKLHPNNNGYKKMAEVWYEALTNILPAPQIFTDLKIFLQGPYNSGTMTTTLNSKGYLQLYAPVQPYNTIPWNYNGNESVDTNFFISNPSIVDWILVELRNKDNPCSVIAARAGFIKNDGTIVDIDGSSSLSFNNISSDNYYLAVKHRNHLSVMSANYVILENNLLIYDFTIDSTRFYGGSFAAKELDSGPPGSWGMFCSDGNSDGFIDSVDLDLVWKPQNGLDNYSNGDYNLDGFINAVDKNLFWRLNNGLDTKIPIN